jgi:alpha-tubulin suppressor-like RCC1 family protein
MKRYQLACGMLAFVLSCKIVLGGEIGGLVMAWGSNGWAPVTLGGRLLTNVVAVSAGGTHALALRGDGAVVAWGQNEFGQTSVPAGLNDATAVAAGWAHSLALRKNGTVVEWGDNREGCGPAPPGLSNVVAISAGGGHSLALKRDGTLVSWGDNRFYRSARTTLSNVVAIAAGAHYSGRDLAIKSDGTVVEWSARGASIETGERALVEEGGVRFYANRMVDYHLITGISNAVGIAAGDWFTITGPASGFNLALEKDGAVYGWGANASGQATGQATTNAPYAGDGFVGIGGRPLTNVTAIAAGSCSLALKADHTIVSWGSSAGPGPLSNVVAVAARGNSYFAIVTNTVGPFGR